MKTEYFEGGVKNFRLGWFATGSYMCHCRECGKEYLGDKRSGYCLECTIKNYEAMGEKFQEKNVKSISVAHADFDEQTITLHIEDKELYNSFSFFFGMKLDVDIKPLIKGSAQNHSSQQTLTGSASSEASPKFAQEAQTSVS